MKKVILVLISVSIFSCTNYKKIVDEQILKIDQLNIEISRLSDQIINLEKNIEDLTNDKSEQLNLINKYKDMSISPYKYFNSSEDHNSILFVNENSPFPFGVFQVTGYTIDIEKDFSEMGGDKELVKHFVIQSADPVLINRLKKIIKGNNTVNSLYDGFVAFTINTKVNDVEKISEATIENPMTFMIMIDKGENDYEYFRWLPRFITNY